jgi:NADH:ubiquinone oxidoreductase subunit 2 (subunit N)
VLLLVNVHDALVLYLAVELLAVATYALSVLNGNHAAREAAALYLFVSAAASAVLLFAMAHVYSLAGTTSAPPEYRALCAAGINWQPATAWPGPQRSPC